jgi:hypothetical protein
VLGNIAVNGRRIKAVMQPSRQIDSAHARAEELT